MACYLPKHWDHDLKECKLCDGVAYYDTEKLACVACEGDFPILAEDKLSCLSCPDGT